MKGRTEMKAVVAEGRMTGVGPESLVWTDESLETSKVGTEYRTSNGSKRPVLLIFRLV